MTRTLILGGTAWLGREIARQSVARGEEVTCLARGESGAVPDGASLVESDRRTVGAYDRVTDSVWDKVIELSYATDLVTDALEELADTAAHWTLVSSVSVYEGNTEPGADENATLQEPSDANDYAHAKVIAERLTTDAVSDRLLILRPGLICGPGDPSDRFGYWVARFALALHEPVLVPASENKSTQFIDVRDLAEWVVRASARRLTGIFNAVGSEYQLSTVLRAAAQVAGYTGTALPAGDDWLIAHAVNHWAGPHSLPLWLPDSDRGFSQRSRGRFLEAGGGERGLTQILGDVLGDERTRGLGRARRSGLTREEEERLIADLINGA